MNALLGTEMSLPVRFFIAFAIVLLLIGAAFYILRRFGAGRLAAGVQRNRQTRLAVVDRTAIDTRRELMIVRRDNVEHLILIGGPTDVLVESNIVRAPGQIAVRESAPARAPVVAEPVQALPPAPPAATPLDIGGWPLAPSAEPVPRSEPIARIEPIGRPEPKAMEMQPKPEPKPELRSEPVARAAEPTLKPVAQVPPTPAAPVTFTPVPTPIFMPTMTSMPAATAAAPEVPAVAAKAPEPTADLQIASLAAMMQVSEPAAPKVVPLAAAPAPVVPVETMAAAEPQAPQQTPEEQNLAEMAQRLEAALRRPIPVTAARPAGAPIPLQSAAAASAARARPAAAPPPPAPPRPPATSYESLQREMANLLGRQSGTS